MRFTLLARMLQVKICGAKGLLYSGALLVPCCVNEQRQLCVTLERSNVRQHYLGMLVDGAAGLGFLENYFSPQFFRETQLLEYFCK